MPKKRAPLQFQKPTTPTHPSLASRSDPKQTSSASKSSSAAKSSKSVNDLLQHLRTSQSAAAAAAAAPTAANEELIISSSSNLQSVHPSLKAILNVPVTPSPRPRPGWRPAASAGLGRGRRLRVPPGPAAPSSWLSDGGFRGRSLGGGEEEEEEGGGGGGGSSRRQKGFYTARQRGTVVGVAPPHLGAILPDSYLPAKASLLHCTLKELARNWDWHVVYDLHYLAALPARYKQALLTYIATYSAHGIDFAGLETLFRDGTQLDGAAGTETITHLDLTNSVGSPLRLKDLKIFLTRPQTSSSLSKYLSSSDDPTPDSWDSENLLSITCLPEPGFPSLTHLALSYPSSTPSWNSLLSITPHLPTLTHLSLAAWPFPSLTPNSDTAYRLTPTGPVSYGANHYYSVLDNDFSGAASVLRRLCRSTYCLRWLDLTACGSWVQALGYTDEVEWCGAWGGLEHVEIGEGWVPRCLTAGAEREWLSVLKADPDMKTGAKRTELLHWLGVEVGKQRMIDRVRKCIFGVGAQTQLRTGSPGRQNVEDTSWGPDSGGERFRDRIQLPRKARLSFGTGWEEWEGRVNEAIRHAQRFS
ncbi:MAG: hypothetical protein Q9190_002033 [Brigantiaea leucoxantha]